MNKHFCYKQKIVFLLFMLIVSTSFSQTVAYSRDYEFVEGAFLTIENFKLEWTGTRMPYFTNGIEVRDFSELRIVNFKGTASPINPAASAVSRRERA